MMKENKLTEATLIPLGLAGILFGAIFVFGQSHQRLNEVEKKIVYTEKRQQDLEEKLYNIMQSLARIEEKLANMHK